LTKPQWGLVLTGLGSSGTWESSCIFSLRRWYP